MNKKAQSNKKKKQQEFIISIAFLLMLHLTLGQGAEAEPTVTPLDQFDAARSLFIEDVMQKLVKGDIARLKNQSFESVSVICADSDGFDAKKGGTGMIADVSYAEYCYDRNLLVEVECVKNEKRDLFPAEKIPAVNLVGCAYGCDGAINACLCEGDLPCADDIPQETIISQKINIFDPNAAIPIRSTFMLSYLLEDRGFKAYFMSILRKVIVYNDDENIARLISRISNRTSETGTDLAKSTTCEDSDGFNPSLKGVGFYFDAPFEEACYDEMYLIELQCTKKTLALNEVVVPTIIQIPCAFGCANGICLCEGGVPCGEGTPPEDVINPTEPTVILPPEPPEGPTCFDNIQNQGEDKKDCGGPCPACPPSEKTCIELGDAGDDPLVPGKVEIKVGDGTTAIKPDKCKEVENKKYLVEKFCVKQGEIETDSENIHICDCATNDEGIGYCISPEQIQCADSDAGAGTITVGVEPYETTIDIELLTAGETKKSGSNGEIIQIKTDACVIEGGSKIIEQGCSGGTINSDTKTCPTIDFPDLFGDDIKFVCINGACCNKDYDGDICVEDDAGSDAMEKGTTSLIGTCGTGVKEEKTDTCVIVSCEKNGQDNLLIGENAYNCPAGTGAKINDFDVGFGDAVKEYSCKKTIAGPIEQQFVACKKGETCFEGECTSISCSDSDYPWFSNDPIPSSVPGRTGGILFVESFGKKTPAYGLVKDYCKDDTTLVEYSCGLPPDAIYIGGSDVYITSTEVICANGCYETDDGAYCKSDNVVFVCPPFSSCAGTPMPDTPP